MLGSAAAPVLAVASAVAFAVASVATSVIAPAAFAAAPPAAFAAAPPAAFAAAPPAAFAAAPPAALAAVPPAIANDTPPVATAPAIIIPVLAVSFANCTPLSTVALPESKLATLSSAVSPNPNIPLIYFSIGLIIEIAINAYTCASNVPKCVSRTPLPTVIPELFIILIGIKTSILYISI